MGEYLRVANASKSQYFDPFHFGEGTKRSGFLYGLSGFALGRLLLGELDGRLWLESWAGDALYVVGDESPVSACPLLLELGDPEESSWHVVKDNFDDITLNVLAFLLNHDLSIRYELFQAADRDKQLFATIVQAFEQLPIPTVKEAFISRIGGNWRKEYREALSEVHGSLPVAMTPENRKNLQ